MTDRKREAAAIMELVGDRTKLVPLSEAHIDALYDAGGPREMWTYMPWRMENRDDMARIVMGALVAAESGAEHPFVILDRADGDRVVGCTRYLAISPANCSREIGGTWLHPDVWRTRVNTECKYLLLRHAFETMGDVRVQLKTDLRNQRSQAAIERIGGVREGVLRNDRILPDGYLRSSVYFSILREEWPDVKRRLENRLDAPRAATPIATP